VSLRQNLIAQILTHEVGPVRNSLFRGLEAFPPGNGKLELQKNKKGYIIRSRCGIGLVDAGTVGKDCCLLFGG